MKGIKVGLIFVLLLFVSMLIGVSSVSGAGYSPSDPIVKSNIMNSSCNCIVTGNLTVMYPDGRPVFLGNTRASLEVCDSSGACSYVTVGLKQLAVGLYGYTFKSPSCGKDLTVLINSGMLSDDNGRQFPSTSTSIGLLRYPSLCISVVTTTTAERLMPDNRTNIAHNNVGKEVQNVTSNQKVFDSRIGFTYLIIGSVFVGSLIVILPRRKK